jgi:hypothetical protein
MLMGNEKGFMEMRRGSWEKKGLVGDETSG